MSETRLPLVGADFALHALGAYWRRIGGSNNATLVVECAERLDPRRIERALAATNGYHAPAVYPRPGLGVFLNGYGEHRNLVVVWMDGVVAEAEVDEIIAAIAPDLGWDA